jgi:hypothetical protein
MTASQSSLGSVMGLYQELPADELLQLCYMRPAATDVCPPLPFLLERSPSQIPACTPRLAPLLSVMGTAGPPDARDGAAGEGNLLDATERALLANAPLPPAARHATPAAWRAAFAATSQPLRALEPGHLARLACELREGGLADLLLRHPFARLLELPCPDGLDDDTEPLPPPYAELLAQLLRAGTALRLSNPDFDRDVAAPLRAHHPLGPRAAAQASLMKVANGPGV